MAKRAPWDKIVEQVFPYMPAAGPAAVPSPYDFMLERVLPGFDINSARKNPASLQSSIFRHDSWETTRQNNLEQQFELVQQSPLYGPFITNALYIQTTQPRYGTHVILVQAKIGLGLGQWSQLGDYQVLSLEEVLQLVHKRRSRATTTIHSTTTGALDRTEQELMDMEEPVTTTTTTATAHPQTTMSRQKNDDDDDDNDPTPNNIISSSSITTMMTTTTTTTIRVPILFDVQVDDFVMMKPFCCV
jgi:hypothetical protein